MAIGGRLIQFVLTTALFGFTTSQDSKVNCPAIPNGNVTCGPHMMEFCLFDCDKFYKRNPNNGQQFIVCGDDEKWNRNTSELCIPIVCDPLVIPNGRLDRGCGRTGGENCSFSCLEGFQKTTIFKELACVGSIFYGGWSANPHIACTAPGHQCSDRVVGGHLNYSCTRLKGDYCNVICDSMRWNSGKGFFCNNELKWNPPIDYPCPAVTCPKEMKNGLFSLLCRGVARESCQFSCDAEFYPSAFDVTCLDIGVWSSDTDTLCLPHPTTAADRCGTTIPNGHVTCRDQYHTCQYFCNSGYEKSYDSIYCRSDGRWERDPRDLCYRIQTSDQDVDYSMSINVGIGIGGMVLILLICFIIFSCFLRKRSELMRARSLGSTTQSTTASNVYPTAPSDVPPRYESLTHTPNPQVAPPPYQQTENYLPSVGLECSPPAYTDVIKDWNTLEIADDFKESPTPQSSPHGRDNPSFTQEENGRYLRTVAESEINMYTAESEGTTDNHPQGDRSRDPVDGTLAYI